MSPLLLLACADPAPAGPPNILLVSLDTVRADHLSPYGSTRDTTPTLTEVAARGTTFDAAFSQGNESAYSHGALFTGRYASELADPDYNTYAVPEAATLVSEALRAYGYDTAAFTAGGHVTADFGFDQGWATFSAEPGFASLFDTGPKLLAWLDNHDRSTPWFAFLHSYDAHRPYSRPGPWDHLFARASGTRVAETIAADPCLSEMVRDRTLFPELTPTWFAHVGGVGILSPSSYRRLAEPPADTTRVPITDADVQHLNDHYDGSLFYLDTLLGLVLGQLEARGALDNTVVVLLSDHGEDLLDHGYMNHRTGLYDTCTHVPLIVWGPGFRAGARSDALVDGRDVAATILALAGAMPPADSGGRDLRRVAAGEGLVDAVFAEGVMDQISVRTRDARLVYSDAPLGDPAFVATLRAAPLDARQFELYDHRTDPGEHTNLLDGTPTPEVLARAEALREALAAWRGGLRTGTFVLPQDKVSPEVAQQLREHGYWGEAPAPPTPALAPRRAPSEAGPTGVPCKSRLTFLPPERRGP